MNTVLKARIKIILETINKRGLPKWKPGSDIYHLKRRKKRKQIPDDWVLKDYKNLILNIMNNIDNDVHLYHLKGFNKEYFIFDDGNWIVIVGEDGMMESAFWNKEASNYLLPSKGYTYIGKVKEVWE